MLLNWIIIAALVIAFLVGLFMAIIEDTGFVGCVIWPLFFMFCTCVVIWLIAIICMLFHALLTIPIF